MATNLVESLQTPDAVRIASYALYNTRNFADCLAVLDQAPAPFFGGEVPPDLRRLRVLAQGAIGALPEAIKTAREVFEQSPTRDAFLELCQLYLQVGDFKNLAITARFHSKISDLSAFNYLRLAFPLKTAQSPPLSFESSRSHGGPRGCRAARARVRARPGLGFEPSGLEAALLHRSG